MRPPSAAWRREVLRGALSAQPWSAERRARVTPGTSWSRERRPPPRSRAVHRAPAQAPPGTAERL